MMTENAPTFRPGRFRVRALRGYLRAAMMSFATFVGTTS